MRQPGFPLIIELKVKKRSKSKRLRLNPLNTQFRGRFDGQGSLSPVFSSMHGKVIYVMSAKLIKNVTMTVNKSILSINSSDYPNPTVEKDVTVNVKETVVHTKKRMRPSEEQLPDIYEKEYNTTSEYRRKKHQENMEIDQDNLEDSGKCEEVKEDNQHDTVKNEDAQNEIKSEDKEEKEGENPESEKSKQDANQDKEMKPEDGQKEPKADKEQTPMDTDASKEVQNKANGETAEDKQNEENKEEEDKVEGNQTEAKDDTEEKDKAEQDKQQEEDDESDEEYSGEGCFIGYKNTDTLRSFIKTPMQRYHEWHESLRHFKFITPKTRVRPIECVVSKVSSSNQRKVDYEDIVYKKIMSHRTVINSLKFTNSLYFPHRNLVQYDCGKLHKLSMLLKTLKAKGSKVLIFTQMTKMLNLLEQFLNLHGYTYIRLDGSVKVEMRQKLVDSFNLNKKIFCFISSTR